MRRKLQVAVAFLRGKVARDVHCKRVVFEIYVGGHVLDSRYEITLR